MALSPFEGAFLKYATQQAAEKSGLNKDDYFLEGDHYHPNPASHRAMALARTDILVKRGLVPVRRD